MKSIFLIFFLITCLSYAQEEHAWIYFNDKPNVEAALQNPTRILSPKAIQRKILRGTPIDERDIPVNKTYIDAISERENVAVKATSKWLNCVHVIGTVEAISELAELEFVAGIEFRSNNLNFRNSTANKRAGYKLETAVDFNYGSAANQTNMLSTDLLHENDYTGKDITIAVIDAGFPNVNSMNSFERLRSQGKILGGYDFPNRSDNYNNPELSNHGTLVLSTMAGFIKDLYVGTAPDASYYLFRTEIAATETPIEESYWLEAAERADSLGVDLINTSLGYTLFDDPNYSYSPQDMDGKTAFISRAANIATEKGILVVVSAGNRGDADDFQIIGAPADANVLSVGAVDKNRNYASFSSTGPSADGRIKPDVAAQGLEIAAIDQFNNLVQVSGTSFASPILAGSIASFWQIDPSLTNLEVMQYVKEISNLFSSPTKQLGYGIPDFSKALGDQFTNNKNPDELALYQNPVFNDLRFNNPTDQTFKISIFDTLGQLILQKDKVQNEIDLSGFSRGIYIAMFEQKSFRKSFIIIKK